MGVPAPPACVQNVRLGPIVFCANLGPLQEIRQFLELLHGYQRF